MSKDKHIYAPDYMAAGDCRVCGRVAQDEAHIKLAGITVISDHALPDDVFEIRDKNGVILGRSRLTDGNQIT
jgi:hypothetical protein